MTKRPTLTLRGKKKYLRAKNTAAATKLDPHLTQAVPDGVAPQSWQLTGAAITGLGHWRKQMPCQDAVHWRTQPRPVLVLSDGAGSSPVSERGAATLTAGIARLLRSMEDLLIPWLDQAQAAAQLQAPTQQWSQRILLHAQGLLKDLADSERRSVRDVRATLLMVVVGQHHSFWWQVGDGAIVVQEAQALRTLSQPSQSKGEFANQTCFVDAATTADIQHGLLPTQSILGWALMSDGGAEKLVSYDGKQVAGRLGQWFAETAAQTMQADKLALAYHEPHMWERTTLDDRAIVLAARQQPQAGVSQSPPPNLGTTRA